MLAHMRRLTIALAARLDAQRMGVDKDSDKIQHRCICQQGPILETFCAYAIVPKSHLNALYM